MATREEMIRELNRRDMIAQLQARDANKKVVPDTINDSMPEWLNPNDRSVVKNLSSNDDEAISYLQKQYPDAEFKKSDAGDVLARKRGETAYGKLDPSFSPLSNPMGTIKDLWNDTKDLGYDALQAGAETAGVAAGAVAGLGAGSLPSAVAGGAAGAGAASTLKQMLRQKYGLSDSFDGGEVLTDAALGGLMPVAFHGAGKALKYGAQKVAPKLYSKATGLSVDALKEIADNGDNIANMDDIQVADQIKNVKGAVTSNIQDNQAKFREEFAKLRGTGTKVSIDPVVKRLDDMIAAAREKRIRSGSNYLAEDERVLQEMKDRVMAGNYNGEVRGTSKAIYKNGAAYESTPEIARGWNESEVPSVSDMMSGKTSGTAYKPHGAKVADGDKVVDHIKGDLDFQDYADIMQGMKGDFIDYNKLPGGKIGKGADLEERSALDLVNFMKDEIAKSSDGASSALNKQYTDHLDDVNYFNRKFKDETATQSTLANYSKGKDKILKGKMQKLDPAVLKKLQDSNKILEINNYLNPVNTGNVIKEGAEIALGKSPLEKLLGAGGAAAGYVSGGPVMGVLGAGAGRGIGKLLTSPKSVLAITKAAKAMNITVEELAQKMQANPWLMQSILGVSYAGSNR